MLTIGTGEIARFADTLREQERAAGTVEKYVRDAGEFAAWLGERELTRETAAEWKEQLLARGLAPVTVNSKLSAVNRFLSFLGREDCRARYLRIQRRLFRGTERELTKGEYLHLVETAERQGKRRLALLMETVCATGIRFSEVRYITVEAARVGRADISLKGKIRTILIPGKLCRKLLKYAEKEKPPRARYFSPEAGRGCRGGRYGRR